MDRKPVHEVDMLQGLMVNRLRNRFPNLPDWLDTRDTEAGNALVFVDKRTGKEVEIGLCDCHGFLKAVEFLS